MQYKLFQIPAHGSAELEEELNLFLRSHRIVSVQKSLQPIGDVFCWNFCVEYLQDGRTKESSRNPHGQLDYRELLSDEDFSFFSRLREVRKQQAHQEGVPVYTVATNSQLAQMVKNRAKTLSALKEIEGFGDGKANRYGQAFLEILLEMPESSHETSGESDFSNL